MERLLTMDELIQWLGISEHTLYQWTSHRQIPYIKVGKLIRFRESDIMEWLERRKVKMQNSLKFKEQTAGQRR